MERQLLFSKKNNSKNLFSKTCRLTNSINSMAYKTFSNWGGITYEDILSNYPKETIDKCWYFLARSIIENYLGGKGTYIKGLGTFTLTNIETDLDGTTNKQLYENKRRYPVFIVSNEFIDYIKAGIFTEKSGLIQYMQTKIGNLPIVKVNYAKISYGVNICKEECFNIISSIIKNMADKIRRGIFKDKEMKELGVFLVKEDVFGMKFNNNIIDEFSLKTQKLNNMKRNIRFYMETKDSERLPYYNISDIDLAEREIRPNLSVITTISPSADEWLKKNMSIDVAKIKESPREDLFFKNAENKKEYYVNQKFFRPYPIQDLYGLKIPQNILEGIYNNRNILIRNMKQKDRHGDGLIPKFDFLTIFSNTNCHHKLRFELIEKMINIYLENDPNIIMVNYVNLINAICKDIKMIIDKEYLFFPIQKYNRYILPDNKRAQSQNCFSRDTGNLHFNSISSLNKYKNLPKIEEFNLKEDINKIKNVSNKLIKYTNKMISYVELKAILEIYMINLSKIKIIHLLKFLDIKNPNVFSFNEFMKKIYSYSEDSSPNNKNFKSLQIDKTLSPDSTIYKKTYNSYDKDIDAVKENDRYFNNTISSGFHTSKNKLSHSIRSEILSKQKQGELALKNNTIYSYTDIKEKINEKEEEKKQNINVNVKKDEFNLNLKENEMIVNCIKIIKDRIFEKQKRLDLISEYFDILLKYNIFRLQNVISPDEFEKVLKLENFNFSDKEFKLLFKYIDTKKDGLIDRIEFIDALKNVPHPISTMQNYIINNNFSIIDLAYKMEIELYKIPIKDILNTKLNLLEFQGKIRLINSNFSREFSSGLFNSIGRGDITITYEKIFDVFNVKKDESYKELYNKRNEIFNTCVQSILSTTTFFELKQKLTAVDKTLTGKIPIYQFMNIMKKILNGKLSETNLLHLLRMHEFIDKDNNVKYHSFIMLLYLNGDETMEAWYKCLETFMNFLKEECNNDLFMLIVKFNNMCNNMSIKKTIDENKLYEFIRTRSNLINFPLELMKKFDYDRDGKISQDDLKNVILKYVDKHFFDNKKKMKEDLIKSKEDKFYNENKQLYIYIKQLLNKKNMTMDAFFNYLDYNKDTYVDKNEFIDQLLAFPNFDANKFPLERIEQFFTYLDEYKNGKVDLNTLEIKINIFDDDINLHQDHTYKGNTTIEDLLLTEFSKYYIENSHLSDTEIFSILDNDNDGVISKEDLKNFGVNLLKMNEKQLTYNKLLHFITCVSSNKDENLVLADIQNLMQAVRNNDMQKYFNTIYNNCNEAITLKNKDTNWIKEVVDILGMYINQKYLNNMQEFYDDCGKTIFRTKGEGLYLDNFIDFMEINFLLFQSFQMNEDKYKVLFNYLSNNKKFITIEDLNKVFKNYDYYGWMHKYLIKFFRDNFPTCDDAFKYFHKVKTFKDETPNSNDPNYKNDFITKKEFFDGIFQLFPNKFPTNTILNYYNIIIKKNKINSENNTKKGKDDLDIVKYSEFNYIYYDKINYDKTFKLSLKKESKIKTTRPDIYNIHFYSTRVPFTPKNHPISMTPYDMDPLDKIKKLIQSSKVDFKTEFNKFIRESDNGKANQFQFRNMIKKLDLGLTNIEIEDIMYKSGLTYEGYINLIDFYKYMTEENNSIVAYKKSIVESLKEMKQLIIKYYTNPKLGFELNDTDNKKIIDFDKFRKIVIDLYKRDNRSYPPPPYSILKSMYDYIDIRKDGIIDINEWCKIFASFEGKLDAKKEDEKTSSNLRCWEMTNSITDVYKLIARNNKIIKKKVIESSITGDCTVIQTNNLIEILKDVLPRVFLSPTQWRMIASLGEGNRVGLVDYNVFIKIIKLSSKISKSHMKI